jgi:curved DNA-binding protein CbpA
MTGPGSRDDEADAVREHLRAKLERLEGADARGALGLEPSAGEAEARAAFRALAKRYHPARFARSEREVVRLANEVFLRLREAHDELAAPLSRTPRASAPSPAAKGVPRPSPAHAEPAEARSRAQRGVRAARLARQLGYAAHPAETPARDLLAETRAAEARANEEFEAALALLEAGPSRASEARQALHALAAAHPRNRDYRAHFHCALAVERVASGRHAEAHAEIERALALSPDLPRALELRAQLARGPRTLLESPRRR